MYKCLVEKYIHVFKIFAYDLFKVKMKNCNTRNTYILLKIIKGPRF